MARVIGGVLGNFKGKLGKVAAKIVGGETILCARPSSFNVSYSPKIVESRKKFSVNIAFASSVSALPALHSIWSRNLEPRWTASNMISKQNFNLSSSQGPTLNNIITPDNGFQTPVIVSAIAAGKLTGTLAILDSVEDISFEEVNLSINAVICLSDPKAEGDPFYKMISLSKEIANFNFSKTYNFEIDLNAEDAGLVTGYNQKIIYIAVVTKRADDKVVQYSRSCSLISN
jgi:hypothetical protein